MASNTTVNNDSVEKIAAAAADHDGVTVQPKSDETNIHDAAVQHQVAATTTKETHGCQKRAGQQDDETSKERVAKRVRSEKDEENEQQQQQHDESAVIVDKAEELGFKAGDRLEVEWQVEREGNDTTTTTRHWGGTLLAHDGRTKEGFAIRVIDYDPYPEGGFPERSKEDVVFITEYLMIDPESGDELRFRREGADAVVGFREEDLNEMLASTLNNQSEAWSKLSAAQQAQMADIISTGKERLLSAIQSRWDEQPGRVITAEEMPGILEQAFQGM